MSQPAYQDLAAFLVVAREGSFTRAAAQLGVTPSALSHAIRGLEERVGLRLLNRTTRSVTTTEAGQRLCDQLEPHFLDIQSALDRVGELRDAPSGTVRISASNHAIDTLLWPRLRPLLAQYPDIRLELSADSRLVDIAADRFDAGVRLGEQLAPGMIAVRIGPDLRMAAVASPSYLAGRQPPVTPQELAGHRCINLRFLTQGDLYAWEFEQNDRETRVQVEGPLVVDNIDHALRAAVDGVGIAYVMRDRVESHLASGVLVQVLEDWSPPFSGYHLYYPSRRRPSQAFSLVVDTLRSEGPR
ncbi:MAG: LysR family transcriptional regulator [Gammaproteobacteria bacterium]|nr:MAG: LysR family transcriptional regulator [Gammaproteobacteria bacterium]